MTAPARRAAPEPIPWRHKMEPDAFYNTLDAGIRFAVRVLHAAGIETHQSCQGGKGHCYDRPTIDLSGSWHTVDGFAALAALAAYGLPVDGVNHHWPVWEGRPVECFWRVTFSRPMPERANERPNFVCGYQSGGRA